MLGSLPTPLAGGSSAKGQRPVVGPGRHARLVSSLLLDGDAIAWSWQQLTTCLQRWDSESKGELTGVHTRGHQPMWGPATHHAQAGRNSLVALESAHRNELLWTLGAFSARLGGGRASAFYREALGK